jgi:hypothetical protein
MQEETNPVRKFIKSKTQPATQEIATMPETTNEHLADLADLVSSGEYEPGTATEILSDLIGGISSGSIPTKSGPHDALASILISVQAALAPHLATT